MTKLIKNFIKYLLSTFIPDRIYSLVGYLYLDSGEKKFVAFCKKKIKFTGKKNKGFIIVDIFYVPETLIGYAYFLNALQKKSGHEIRHYIYQHGLLAPRVAAVYDSFNSKKSLRILLSSKQKNHAQKIFQEIKGKIKTKEDVHAITYDHVNIGLDIYESYLRDYNQPTVDVQDPRLFWLIENALNLAIFWDDFFRENAVSGYVTSHDVYVWMNIGCKMAYKHNVPVYLPNNRNIVYVAEPFSVYAHFLKYPEWFKMLPAAKQAEALEFSKSRLDKKLGGEIGVDMHYTMATSFKLESTDAPVLRKSDKLKVLIASHCFFDNPHAYNELMFVDFYEWISFLGELSKKTDYDWYLKVHPDPLPGTEEVVKNILKKYNNITLINYELSHHQLISEGMNFVLTCHGTIGEEYPLLGAQVLNTAYNPRSAYSFNFHATDKKNYEDLVLNLKNLKQTVDKRDVYEFYYMNKYYCWVDDLIFKSYRNFLDHFIGSDRINGLVFDYFFNELTEERHQEISQKMNDFIDSKKTNYFELINQ